MSYSKKEFVEAALTEIGKGGLDFDIQPEEVEQGVERLDAMMAEWNVSGVRLPYPLAPDPMSTELDAKTNVPDWANKPIICNFALELAPSYGKEPSRQTKIGASSGYKSLLALAAQPNTVQFPETLPRGAGQKTWRTTRNPFFTNPTPRLPTGQGDNLDLPGRELK